MASNERFDELQAALAGLIARETVTLTNGIDSARDRVIAILNTNMNIKVDAVLKALGGVLPFVDSINAVTEENIAVLDAKVEAMHDNLMWHIQVSLLDSLKIKADACEAGIKTEFRSEVTKVMTRIDQLERAIKPETRNVMLQWTLGSLHTLFMMVWVAACCAVCSAGAAFAVMAYMEASKRGELDASKPYMTAVDRMRRRVFPNVHTNDPLPETPVEWWKEHVGLILLDGICGVVVLLWSTCITGE